MSTSDLHKVVQLPVSCLSLTATWPKCVMDNTLVIMQMEKVKGFCMMSLRSQIKREIPWVGLTQSGAVPGRNYLGPAEADSCTVNRLWRRAASMSTGLSPTTSRNWFCQQPGRTWRTELQMRTQPWSPQEHSTETM